MKKLIFSVALLSAALSASAEDHPLWMRYPAISPDGTTIAFAYKGDLYSVSVNGGEARQLTTHAASIRTLYGALTAKKLPSSLTAKEVSTSS